MVLPPKMLSKVIGGRGAVLSLERSMSMPQKAHPYSIRCPSSHLGFSFSSSCLDRALVWEVGTWIWSQFCP